jgi:signal transduction histidine kinase
MRRLIDQLMLLAQIDAAASAQIAPEQIELVETARDVVSLVAPAILAEGKMIALDVKGMLRSFAGRRKRLRRRCATCRKRCPGDARRRHGPGLRRSRSRDGRPR